MERLRRITFGTWRLPLLIGLVLRLLGMPFSIQDDTRFIGDLLAMHVDARQFVFPQDGGDSALYPPLAYYTLYAYQRLITPLVPHLTELDKSPESRAVWYTHPHRFRALFLLKLWYLPFDLLCGYVLWRLLGGGLQGTLGAWAWYLNPVVIYTGAIHGQFDAVPACMTLLALWAMQKNAWMRAGIALGIGGAFKLYPMLFVPLLLVVNSALESRPVSAPTSAGVRWRALGVALLIFALPYLGKLGVYRLDHSYYSNGLAGQVQLTQGQSYSLFGVGYLLLLGWMMRHKNASFLWVSGAILSLYYAQATFDLHYLTWIMPFAILQTVQFPRTRWVWGGVVLCALLLQARALPFGVLYPLDEAFFSQQRNLLALLGAVVPPSLITQGAHTFLVGGLLWLVYECYPRPAEA